MSAMPRMEDIEGNTPVERFLVQQVLKRDQEIAELKKQVLQLQCRLLYLGEYVAPGAPSPAAKRPPPCDLLGGAVERTASVASLESCGSDVPSAPSTPIPETETPKPPQSPLVQLLSESLVFDVFIAYLPDCGPLMCTCSALNERLARYCCSSLQMVKAFYTLEPGVANESAYEALEAALKRRKRSLGKQRARRRLLTAEQHAFVMCLKHRFNTLVMNVNHPSSAFLLGPPGLRPQNNPCVAARGLNVAVLSTLHSSVPLLNCTDAFRWLSSSRVRLFYPRGSNPHMLAILKSVEELSIRPAALVVDVCLVKQKWFPGIDHMREYPNLILLPEVPSKESLDEGEAARIREKFNRYLQSFASSGQTVYVVLDHVTAQEVAKEIAINRVNVLSIPLPEKEGPLGLKVYPQFELLTVLDSVFDDELTLLVPEEREAIPSTSPAPGAGGYYRYSSSQVFSFSPQPQSRRLCDDPYLSDSSTYSMSSHGSHGSVPPTDPRRLLLGDLDQFFKNHHPHPHYHHHHHHHQHVPSFYPPYSYYPPPFPPQLPQDRRRNRGVTKRPTEHIDRSPPRKAKGESSSSTADGILTPAERKTTVKIAEEDGFTLSITSDPDSRGVDGLAWGWTTRPDTAPPS